MDYAVPFSLGLKFLCGKRIKKAHFKRKKKENGYLCRFPVEN